MRTLDDLPEVLYLATKSTGNDGLDKDFPFNDTIVRITLIVLRGLETHSVFLTEFQTNSLTHPVNQESGSILRSPSRLK